MFCILYEPTFISDKCYFTLFNGKHGDLRELSPTEIYSWRSTFLPFYSFFTSPYQLSILEVKRTSIALNADDVR